MRALVLCLLMPLALAGCDRNQYDYVVRYQEYAHASLDEGGRRVFLEARADFVDVQPAAAGHASADGDVGDMTADDRYRYVVAHPEIYGSIASREEFEEQFGDGIGGTVSVIEIVMSGDHEAVFSVAPAGAVLERGGASWAALAVNPGRVAVGNRSGSQDQYEEGAPVTLRFPALPEVAIARERLRQQQINRKPAPANDPITLTVAMESGGRTRVVVFTFERVAEHPPFAPNFLYRLYSAR